MNNNYLGESVSTNTIVEGSSGVNDRDPQGVVSKKPESADLASTLNSRPVSTKYVTNQYTKYKHLDDKNNKYTKSDMDSVIKFIIHTPEGSSVGFESYNGLDNVFHLTLPGYEGRSYVVSDIADSEAYQALSDEDKKKYFLEIKSEDGTTIVKVKIKALKDEKGKHITNITQNLDKLPEPVRAVLGPYFIKMDLISQDRDIDCDTAVAIHILGITDYDKNNIKHQQRAMAATAAMREFYGWYYTDTIKNGSRWVGKVVSRGGVNAGGSGYLLMLGELAPTWSG